MMELATLPGVGGASFHRGSSKQDYETPREFIAAVEERFGVLHHDLAASPENRKALDYYGERDDALSIDWAQRLNGTAWLNPPFGNIAPWAERCARFASSRLKILFLVPASVGSEWYAEHVFPHALTLALRPRLSFDGKNSFPKDLILACYGLGVRGFDLWRWK